MVIRVFFMLHLRSADFVESHKCKCLHEAAEHDVPVQSHGRHQ